MAFIGMVLAFVGCVVTVIGLISVANIFGLVSKDHRHQSNTTDQRVQKHNIWILLIGLALVAVGFAIVFAGGA